MGQQMSPSVFNTGQVLFGWLAAFRATGEAEFADAARRAATYLVEVQESDGHWRKGNSQFARSDATLYNARTAWALAAAGLDLDDAEFRAAAAHNLRAVSAAQHDNGWVPDACLNDPVRPLLHTIAYTLRGLLEGGAVLDDDSFVRAAEAGAEELIERVEADGRMSGRFDKTWAPAGRLPPGPTAPCRAIPVIVPRLQSPESSDPCRQSCPRTQRPTTR